ncbi:hypothetical protein R7J20_16770 [Acinetobacter baumannii]|nr:hypothetical protein [Acinetobacter baumannii]MDW5349534.1 hypothetical protein [Acinetobacter baumannii]MDW5367040.1 hypothetical protein [Acinetobacter baumannii]MDW5382295.1 hypothetical protein [Acinetobacter baumannii]
MTTSQNEQLEAAAQYEALKKVPEEYRTADMKAFIEQYEADNNINQDSEVEETTNSVVEAGTNQQAEDTDDLKADPNEHMAAYFKNAEEILEEYLPKIEDTRIKNCLIMSAAASSVAKWSRHDIDVKVASIDLAKDLANVVGSLSFASSQTPTTISKAIKEMQAENPYITLAVTYTDTPRNTSLDKELEKLIKPGNKFIVHTEERSYNHTDLSIASLENIFADGATPKEEKLNPFSPEVTRSRYLLSEVHATGKAKDLIEQLLKLKPPSGVTQEKYKGWVGILAMALLTSQDHYKQMHALMIELAGGETLEKKIKLAVALKKVIPKYESLLNDCHVKAEAQVIPTTLVKSLLEGIGYKEDDMSGAFTDFGYPLKDHRQGLNLEALKKSYDELLKDNNDHIKAYRETLKE